MGHKEIVSPWRLLGAASLSLAAWALPARAELVIFADGRVVKAASHQAKGEQLEIRLPGGGSYSVDRSRVDQIVEDEVAHSDLPPPRVETAPIIRAAPRLQAPQAPTFVPDSAARQQADNDRANKKEKDKSNRGGHGGGHGGGGGSKRLKTGGG